MVEVFITGHVLIITERKKELIKETRTHKAIKWDRAGIMLI